MNLININNETILPIVLYGANRNTSVLTYQKRVMVEKFNLPINYIECPFPMVSHGQMMNSVIRETIDSIKPDYYWFIDMDCIILKKECVNIMYDIVKNKRTIFGVGQQSNHKKNKITNSFIHPYVSQAFTCFSSKIYNDSNRPCLDHWSEDLEEFGGDTAERLTYEVEKHGGIVSLIWPSNVFLKNSPINHLMFGMGNTYSDLVYHAMQQDNPKSQELFIEKCQEVLDGKYE